MIHWDTLCSNLDFRSPPSKKGFEPHTYKLSHVYSCLMMEMSELFLGMSYVINNKQMSLIIYKSWIFLPRNSHNDCLNPLCFIRFCLFVPFKLKQFDNNDQMQELGFYHLNFFMTNVDEMEPKMWKFKVQNFTGFKSKNTCLHIT